MHTPNGSSVESSIIPSTTYHQQRLNEIRSWMRSTNWNIANNGSSSSSTLDNQSHVRFAQGPAPPLPDGTITFQNGTLSGGAAAQTDFITSRGTTAINVTITFDPSLTFPSGHLFYDPNHTGYGTVFIKRTQHEIGHSMGLGHFNPLNPCTQQTAGISVMNDGCGVNDDQNNQPASPTACDNISVNAEYPNA
jgi:hypothetical protein